MSPSDRAFPQQTVATAPPGASLTPATYAATPQAYDAGLLLLRVGLGLIMAAHGTQKLLGWWGDGGIRATGQFFASLGYPSGETMAVVAGLSETLGGLGLVLGLLTPLAAAAVVGTMINAVVVQWSKGLLGGFEVPLVVGVSAAALALTGPGRLAVDRLLPGLRAHRLSYGVAALVLAGAAATVTLLLRS